MKSYKSLLIVDQAVFLQTKSLVSALEFTVISTKLTDSSLYIVGVTALNHFSYDVLCSTHDRLIFLNLVPFKPLFHNLESLLITMMDIKRYSVLLFDLRCSILHVLVCIAKDYLREKVIVIRNQFRLFSSFSQKFSSRCPLSPFLSQLFVIWLDKGFQERMVSVVSLSLHHLVLSKPQS